MGIVGCIHEARTLGVLILQEDAAFRSMIWLMSVLSVLGLALLVQGCAGMSSQQSTGMPPQQMINSHDHPRLANYYGDQAQELREKAKQWEFTAEYYEKHPESDAKATAQHAAHCRAIAQNYQKAADEAEALAREHRAMRPHGMVQ